MTSLNDSPNTAPPTSSPPSLSSPMVSTKKRVARTYGSKRPDVPPSDDFPDADRSFDTLMDGDISTSLSPAARSRGIYDNLVSSQDTKVDDGDDEEKDSGERPKHQWSWRAAIEKLDEPDDEDEDELTPTLPVPQRSVDVDASPSPPASRSRDVGSKGKHPPTSPKKPQRLPMTAIRSDSRLSSRVSPEPEASGSDGERSPSTLSPKHRRHTPSRMAGAPVVEDSESEAHRASSSKPRGGRFNSDGMDASDRTSPNPAKRRRKTTTGRKPTAKVKRHDIHYVAPINTPPKARRREEEEIKKNQARIAAERHVDFPVSKQPPSQYRISDFVNSFQ